MLLTPLLFILYDRVIAPRYANAEDDREMDEIEETSHVIVAGHGRFGGIVARMMRAAGYNPTVIDYSSKQLDMLSRFGIKAYYGDATRADMLQAAGIGEAKLLVIAIDDKEKITEMVHYVHERHPTVHIIARAIDRPHVYELWEAGCRDIVRETYDSSLRMGRSAFEAMGVSRDVAEELVEVFQDADRRGMIEAAPVYKKGVPLDENEEFSELVRTRLPIYQAEMDAKMTEIRQRNARGEDRLDPEGETS